MKSRMKFFFSRGLPSYLIFYVTSSCNAKCKMCFFGKNLNKKDDLSLIEIEKVLDSLNDLFWVNVGGGEPFLRRELVRICKLLDEKNHVEYLSIPTNGLLPERILAKTKKILEECNFNLLVGISLDGLEDNHDRIRGVKGNFKKALKTYSKLKKLKDEFSNFSLGFLTTITNKNVENVEELYDFVKENLNPDFHFSDIMRGTPIDKSYSPPTVDELKSVMNRIIKVQLSYRVGRKLDYRIFKTLKSLHLRIALETMERKRQLIPCHAGRSNGVIFPNGDVAFCELLKVIGNLRKVGYDFKKVWFCEEAEKLRKSMRNGCYCTHSCFQTTNLLKNPRFYPSILRLMVS